MPLEALGRVATRRYRHAKLLTSLLLVIGVSPFFSGRLSWVFEGMLFFSLAVGGWICASSRKRLVTMGLLGAAVVLSRIVGEGAEHPASITLFLASTIAFLALVAASLIRSLVESQDPITQDTLCGAVAVYLILGLIWAFAYGMLELHAPGSFHFGAAGPTTLHAERFLGFSFTTLTTLGYGNVAPQNAEADALTTLEAIVGQFYLAVVIARFVALSIAQGGSQAAGRSGAPE